MIKAIIFDLDGVLVDTKQIHFEALNSALKKQNIYYCDLINSKVIKPLSVFVVKVGGFDAYMKSIGKFGGQNKCPHLLNDRRIAEFILNKYV